MPQQAAAAKPHTCCLFAAIHCEKPFISIRVAIFSNCTVQFVSDLVGNPKDRFSQNEAQLLSYSPSQPGVLGSIPGFSSLSDETFKQRSHDNFPRQTANKDIF